MTLTEAEETGDTFEENAYIKAAAACRESGLPAIADDSGLMVDALDGAPGVYSARYAGEGATDADRNDKLLRELKNVPAHKRGAAFVSVVCCVFPNGEVLTARGECAGTVGFAPRGASGFGYDPLSWWGIAHTRSCRTRKRTPSATGGKPCGCSPIGSKRI